MIYGYITTGFQRGHWLLNYKGYRIPWKTTTIDIGSTHNFIDQQVAARLDCQTSSIEEQSLNLVDGREVQSAAIWKNL